MLEKYIDPFTDFGFKKIFGEEANKDLLMDFLNELITDRGTITELTFLKNEHLGTAQTDRKAIFDLYCQNEQGEKFIVELQKAKQKFFKDRSIYYSTFPIQEQAETGDWNFKLQAVYTIAIMDFVFEENTEEPNKCIYDIRLMDKDTHKVFNDKLRYIYLEMPKFNKTEQDLANKMDKWLFVLKNLAKFQNRPVALQERIFSKLFEIANIAQYSREEQQAYQDSLKYQRDLKNSMDTSFEEGEIKKAVKIAKKMLADGLPIATILKYTDLTKEEIEDIRTQIQND